MAEDVRQLKSGLEDLARGAGASRFGVADLAPAQDFILSHGDDYLAQFPVAVTAAVPMIDAWVDLLPRQQDPLVMRSYGELLEAVDRRWLDIAYSLTIALQDAGYKALPIAEHVSDPVHRRGVFSHKLAAHLAGLGWIGKNTLLVTPERGPRVRLMTVLTTAPLPVTKPKIELAYDGCGACRTCVDVCPAGALSGVPFAVDVPRDARIDFRKCSDYRDQQLKRVGSRHCALCLSVCPFGDSRKRLK
ncbi:MAG: epoxyqueuosine reductase [Chloroflexi bacterium]|nr:epoxyqueuosine reductase [Chloroflexota bacterium]